MIYLGKSSMSEALGSISKALGSGVILVGLVGPPRTVAWNVRGYSEIIGEIIGVDIKIASLFVRSALFRVNKKFNSRMSCKLACFKRATHSCGIVSGVLYLPQLV